ncbi:uncharacterized protein TNCV_3752251 [Trichonephila clavipes]|nr:uncharacterized protein TNCV_3752251 [Trichonephila clavipes]
MDDVLCGAATLEEAIVLRQQLKGILKSAGMELHKLCANHEKLSPDPEQNYNFETLTETKTLGVSWKPNLDCLLIKVKVCLDSSYTKRDVLSTIAKIFDPVGLMAPNDLLPAEEYREWQQFLVSLENINNIEIPRRILVAFPEVIEIHGFADASERCYGAAVYCKSKNLKSETLVRLITSKSRVAPIKSLTIPRLELCAAVLLAKLVKRVVAALQLETSELYLWSDSKIVLAWLRKEPMDLKTFVQNRVAKIQELYPNKLWRHVPSDQNPADLVSRGVDPDKLLQQNLWFVENLKGINKVASPVTTKEFEKAETFLVKKVQEQEFSSDINHLKTVHIRFNIASIHCRVEKVYGSMRQMCKTVFGQWYGGRGVLVWGGIMLGSRTDLHIFDASSVNGTRYCNEILLPYVRLFRGAMGLQFVFMDDNAPCHRTVAAEQLLESEDIERMD